MQFVDHIDQAYDMEMQPLLLKKQGLGSRLKKIERQLRRSEKDYMEGHLGAQAFTSLSNKLKKDTLSIKKDINAIDSQISMMPRLSPKDCRTLLKFGVRCCKSDN